MQRTQIYLLEAQKEELYRIATQKGKALAEIIREAVEMYIVENKVKSKDIILETSGLWKDRDDIDSDKYTDNLRSDLNIRLEDMLR